MKKTLIVYYSWSNGNTERIAKMIQNKLSCDILKIETKEPYKGSYDEIVEQAKLEVEEGFEPEIKPYDFKIEDYDTIILGTPTWWYTMAPAMKYFIHHSNFKDKTVIPFMTNAGWRGHVIKDMKKLCVGANYCLEKEIQFDSDGGNKLITKIEDIENWIRKIYDFTLNNQQ